MGCKHTCLCLTFLHGDSCFHLLPADSGCLLFRSKCLQTQQTTRGGTNLELRCCRDKLQSSRTAELDQLDHLCTPGVNSVFEAGNLCLLQKIIKLLLNRCRVSILYPEVYFTFKAAVYFCKKDSSCVPTSPEIK